MISKFIPREKRKARSAIMLRAKQAKRYRLGVDAETLRWRAMADARLESEAVTMQAAKAAP